MKNIFILSVLMFTSIFSKGQFSSATLTAAGLTCAMCSKAIYSALEKIPSVSKVDANIQSSAFTILFKPGATINPDALKSAVEEAGFSVAKLTLTGTFQHTDARNDAHVNINGNTYHFLNKDLSPLNGVKTLRLVDKNYVSAKEFKKFSSSSNHPCVETGKADQCCGEAGANPNSRIYHVIL